MNRYFGEDLSVLIAAVMGALTAALLTEQPGWSQRASILIVGSSAAVFLVPALCEFWQVLALSARIAAHYVGGMAGHIVARRLLAWFKAVKIDFTGMLQSIVTWKRERP